MQDDELQGLVSTLSGARPGNVPPGVCRDVASVLGVDDVSFALIGAAGQRHTLCASSERARTLDQWQFTLDEGPCIHAAQTGEITSARTSDDTVPWPQLADKARGLGYGVIAGVPLAVAGVRFGALDLQTDSESLPDETVRRAAVLAERLSPSLLDHVASDPGSVGPETDRATVHQATGLVAVQLDVSLEDAIAALRARAWSDDCLLDDLAQGVVRGDIRLDRR